MSSNILNEELNNFFKDKLKYRYIASFEIYLKRKVIRKGKQLTGKNWKKLINTNVPTCVLEALFVEVRTFYIDRYRQWIKDGVMEKKGLCNSIKNHNLLDLFTPQDCDDNIHKYWAYGKKRTTPVTVPGFLISLKYEFTPLRQNIVLLMAAMNGEL